MITRNGNAGVIPATTYNEGTGLEGLRDRDDVREESKKNEYISFLEFMAIIGWIGTILFGLF